MYTVGAQAPSPARLLAAWFEGGGGSSKETDELERNSLQS